MTTYHSNTTHISRSMLSVFGDGVVSEYNPLGIAPRQYEHRFILSQGDESETDAMLVGTCTHLLLLEPHLADRIVDIPDDVLTSNGHRRGKAWEQFVADHPGKVLLRPCDRIVVDRAVAGVRRIIGPLIDHPRAVREVEHYWTSDCGLACRLKADLVVPTTAGIICIDLKTTANLARFAWQIDDAQYWLQDAHYRDGLSDKFRSPVRFLFCAVDKATGLSDVFELDDHAQQSASERHDVLCRELLRRYASGDWADPGEGDVKPVTMFHLRGLERTRVNN